MSFALTAPGTDTLLRERAGNLEGGGELFNAVPASRRASENVDASGPAQSTATTCKIWDLVRTERRSAVDQFARNYAAIRRAEDRELTATEVRALPKIRADHPLASMWRERADSHQRLRNVIETTTPGLAVDIGAGCGWLAANLARSGWEACALDITIEGGDGLAAARHHHEQLLLVRAEMEAIPFAASSVDLAVFNASLHYASHVPAALDEAIRVLRPGGTLAVLDSPIFHDPNAGHMMVQEFAEHTQRAFGLAPATHHGLGFVTEDDLAPYGFTRIEAATGLRKRVHQWRGARSAGRETATRPLLLVAIGADS